MMAADLSRRVLSVFPNRHIAYGFAYGSGVFQQAGRSGQATDTMVDMIFVVDDAQAFHHDNLAANPGHYSRIRHLGASTVAVLQTAMGAHVYFNTHVALGGCSGSPLWCKYGVIETRDFHQDLHSWHTLYIAGRLHKPVLTLFDRGEDNSQLSETQAAPLTRTLCDSDGKPKSTSALIARNLESAMHAALLQLPERFTEPDLYAAVAALSYRGDFRMIIGEDKHKVQNIVLPQVDKFRTLYAPVLKSMGHNQLFIKPDTSVEQDMSVHTKLYHLQRLPDNLLDVMLGSKFRHNEDYSARSLWLEELAERDDLGKIVRHGIYKIVFYPSLMQSIKGIPTAGIQKSIVYSYNKLNKMFKSML